MIRTKNGKWTTKDYIAKLRAQWDPDGETHYKGENSWRTTETRVFYEKTPKKVKKKEKKKEKKKRYKIAYWYLHEYLKPEYMNQAYDYFAGDLEGLVNFAYQQAAEVAAYLTYYPEDHDIPFDDWAKRHIAELEEREERERNLPKGVDIDNAPGTPVIYINENADIPDLYWTAFEHYCDKHPVKNQKQAKKRRIKFIKMVNKQYMKTYGKYAKGKIKKGERFDSVNYMTLCVDKERMIENLKKVMKENAKRTEVFKQEMEKWFTRLGSKVNPDVKDRIMSHSAEVHKNMQSRLKNMVIDLEDNGLPDLPFMTSG